MPSSAALGLRTPDLAKRVLELERRLVEPLFSHYGYRYVGQVLNLFLVKTGLSNGASSLVPFHSKRRGGGVPPVRGGRSGSRSGSVAVERSPDANPGWSATSGGISGPLVGLVPWFPSPRRSTVRTRYASVTNRIRTRSTTGPSRSPVPSPGRTRPASVISGSLASDPVRSRTEGLVGRIRHWWGRV